MNDLGDTETPDPIGTSDRYLIGVVIAFALLALPSTRFQSSFKMAIWTTILFGAMYSFVRPAVKDFTSRVVVAGICFAHFVLMKLLFPYLDSDGYIGIGLAVIAEIVLFSIPVGWLVVRSRNVEQDSNG